MITYLHIYQLYLQIQRVDAFFPYALVVIVAPIGLERGVAKLWCLAVAYSHWFCWRWGRVRGQRVLTRLRRVHHVGIEVLHIVLHGKVAQEIKIEGVDYIDVLLGQITSTNEVQQLLAIPLFKFIQSLLHGSIS